MQFTVWDIQGAPVGPLSEILRCKLNYHVGAICIVMHPSFWWCRQVAALWQVRSKFSRLTLCLLLSIRLRIRCSDCIWSWSYFDWYPSFHSSTPTVMHLSDDSGVSFGGGEKMAIYMLMLSTGQRYAPPIVFKWSKICLKIASKLSQVVPKSFPCSSKWC